MASEIANIKSRSMTLSIHDVVHMNKNFSTLKWSIVQLHKETSLVSQIIHQTI
jgi:hypothetical protein